MYDKLNGRQDQDAGFLQLFRDRRPRLSEEFEAFAEDWISKRGAGTLPLMSDIDFNDLEPFRDCAFIGERIAPGLARIRLAGGQLDALLGRDTRGLPLSALMAKPSRYDLTDLLVEVFDRPAILQAGLVSRTAANRPSLSVELVLLPLLSDLGDVSRLLGCVICRGTIGQAPRRFEFEDVTTSPIQADTRNQQSDDTAQPPSLRLIKKD